MKEQWQVVSSNGVLQVNMKGYVTELELYEDGDPLIRSIKKFNMEEFNNWAGDPITSGDSIDILCIGYWLEDGTYEPPVEDYRKEIKDKIVMG